MASDQEVHTETEPQTEEAKEDTCSHIASMLDDMKEKRTKIMEQLSDVKEEFNKKENAEKEALRREAVLNEQRIRIKELMEKQDLMLKKLAETTEKVKTMDQISEGLDNMGKKPPNPPES